MARRQEGLDRLPGGSEFPTRLLPLHGGAGLAAPTFDPARIHQHIAGAADGPRIMKEAEIGRLLHDPFATLVLRRGVFPRDLGEILEAFDRHNSSPANGIPATSSYLVSEGGQIPFTPGIDKGSSRLITVRSRGNGSPEVLISTLVPAGEDPRSSDLINEVQAWDPDNSTMHFYQRQLGAWFWCGQSDMALAAPTRGEGPFDSHVNGYCVMKELRSPWVHWHGPDLPIAETAYAPGDPLVGDPLFLGKDSANNLEHTVIRPLMERWNAARFAKAVRGRTLRRVPELFRQVVESTTANLVSTRALWTQVQDGSSDLADLPPTFFFDWEALTAIAGLQVEVPPLQLSASRYVALVDRYGLRRRGNGVDQPGDAPVAFVVPERAFEDHLAVRILVANQVMSPRLAACLLMIDFSNPVDSARRSALAKYAPASVSMNTRFRLDRNILKAVAAAAPATRSGSPERELLANWGLGPDDWKPTFELRVERFIAKVARRLTTDAGADDIFRLAESRRRAFKARPLAEFGLSLPQATGIPETAAPLRITEAGRVVAARRPRGGTR